MNDLPVIDGDVGYRGVDERTNPGQLPPGWVSYAENYRFRNGVAEPREGDSLLLSMTGDGTVPWAEIYTASRYEDPNTGQELWLVAADGGVYYTAANNVAQAIALPAGVTLTRATAVQFVQCFNVVILLRGATADPLVMKTFGAGFETISQTTNGTGTLAIPRSRFGIFFQNRLLLIKEGDQVVASDIQDYTRYSIFNDFRINTGDNDRLVAMHPITASTLLMLKEQSVWMVDNIHGDLSGIVLRNVTTKYGCLAPFSVVSYGRDVAWLSDRGVVTLKLTEQNEVQGTDVSLSDPLVRTLLRLNWSHAAQVVAETWDNKIYVALPLDDAVVLDDTNLATTGGATYSLSNLTLTGLTAGATYRYTQNAADDLYLINGNHRLDGSGDFIAASTTAQIFGTNGEPVTATVYEVLHEGVNNGVVVFDSVTQAWTGLDTRPGLNLKRWVKITYQGRLRLGYVSWDGETRLYEEGWHDEIRTEIAAAYVDVQMIDYPANGVTLQAGAGTVVTSDAGSETNTGAASWGVNSNAGLAQIGANLWSNNDRGFASTNGTVWTAGGLTLQELDRGVRFSTGTTTLPVVKVAGATVSSSGFYGTNVDSNEPEACFYIDAVSGVQPVATAIATVIETRGFHGAVPGRKKMVDARLELNTWNPTFTVTRLLDGVNETQDFFTGETRSRTEYITGETYPETNAGDNHGNPLRKDYSVVLDSAQTGVDLGENGVNISLEQSYHEPIKLNQEEGRHCRLKISNSSGRLTVKAAHVNARPGQQSYLTQV